MFGAGSTKERLLERFYDDRSMAISHADDYERFSRTIDKIEEDEYDLSECSVKDVLDKINEEDNS